mmetsp:Transcript_40564/g.95245  ORF Transcript_40564/g.95245 Transcript_40564/m.95245 type:complete len:173 (-) Transcript_40564:87-605(-)
MPLAEMRKTTGRGTQDPTRRNARNLPASVRRATAFAALLLPPSHLPATVRAFPLASAPSAALRAPLPCRPSCLKMTPFERNLEAARRKMGLPEEILTGTSLEETARLRKEREAEDARETARKSAGGFRTIEEWEAEQDGAIGREVAWERAVQFDGLRYGDRVKQDGILRKHL